MKLTHVVFHGIFQHIWVALQGEHEIASYPCPLMWHLVVVHCWKYFVSIFPEANALLCSRTESGPFLSYFVPHTEDVSAFNRSYPSHFGIQNYHSPLAQIFLTSFIPQSANLFFWDFAGGRVRSDNRYRHNQRKQNEVHAFVRVLQPCWNGNFFVEKDILLKSLFRSCFQMENIIFLLISLI